MIVAREINGQTGRSVARINGRAVNSATLREIGGRLVDIHGQHEGVSLFNTRTHIDILDRYGNLLPLREEVGRDRRSTARAYARNSTNCIARQHAARIASRSCSIRSTRSKPPNCASARKKSSPRAQSAPECSQDHRPGQQHLRTADRNGRRRRAAAVRRSSTV